MERTGCKCSSICTDLMRPHAAEYVSAIGQAAREAGTELPATWVKDQLHRLKHPGPTALLADLRALRAKHPEVQVLADKLAYLEKREAHMQYPSYQQQGWPIGSGMVESANKQVMQARLCRAWHALGTSPRQSDVGLTHR